MKNEWNCLLRPLVWLVSGVLLWTACSTASTKKLSDEDQARLYVQLANGALMEGDPTAALQSLTEGERLAPNLPELHHSKALAFQAKHDLSRAIAEARRALEIKPNYTEASETLGTLLMEDQKYREAMPYLTRSANDPLNRESYKPLTSLGIIYYRLGEFKSATSYFNRAILSDGINSCIAHYYRGHIELRDSHFSDAIRDYQSATSRICANFADAHLALGIAYERSKQYHLARKKFLEIQQRYPNSKMAETAIDHLSYLP